MLFDVILVPLHCEECERETEHVVKFLSYSSKTHHVKLEYYCQDCFGLDDEPTKWQKEILFEMYFALQETYGDPRI